ncbi:MAG: Uma2 family endonuclease [Planctomycetales bacterium]
MSHSEPLTIAEFVAQRDELPDGGRWLEMEAGRLVTFQPPSVEHGTAVMNLSKALSEFVHREPVGYACFELGLIVARNPDTLKFPAMCFFSGGPLFAESDKVVSATRPVLVAEVASSNDRRRGMEQRVTGWLDWGVAMVWVLDPLAKAAHVFEKHHQPLQLAEHQTLLGGQILSGFKIKVGELFTEPGWYR